MPQHVGISRVAPAAGRSNHEWTKGACRAALRALFLCCLDRAVLVGYPTAVQQASLSANELEHVSPIDALQLACVAEFLVTASIHVGSNFFLSGQMRQIEVTLG